MALDARVVAHQPGEAEDELKVAQLHHMGGKAFRVYPMYTNFRRVVMGDGTGGWGAAVNEFEGDGMGVQAWL